jgi:hypothetical protein
MYTLRELHVSWKQFLESLAFAEYNIKTQKTSPTKTVKFSKEAGSTSWNTKGIQ